MTTIQTLSIATYGQAKDESGALFEWRLQTNPVTGSRSLHVQRHGGHALSWPDQKPLPPDGPAETRLMMFQIGQHLGFPTPRGRRFVAMATNDHSSGTRQWSVIDTAASRPALAHVCSAPEEWAAAISRSLEYAGAEPDDVPF